MRGFIKTLDRIGGTGAFEDVTDPIEERLAAIGELEARIEKAEANLFKPDGKKKY